MNVTNNLFDFIQDFRAETSWLNRPASPIYEPDINNKLSNAKSSLAQLRTCWDRMEGQVRRTSGGKLLFLNPLTACAVHICFLHFFISTLHISF